MRRVLRIIVGTTTAVGTLGLLDVLLGLAVRSQWQTVVAPGPASLSEALTLVVLAVAALLAVWLTASTTAALLAHLPGQLGEAARRCASAWAPAVSRRVAAAIVGAVVGAALAPGAAAFADGQTQQMARTALTPVFTATSVTSATSATSATSVTSAARTQAPPPAPGWTPSRPLQRPQPAAGLVTGGSGGPAQRSAHGVADIVVHRGDTLWEIVRRHLGPGSSDTEVAAAWPTWHRANRDVIGADPDLIRPGQVLRPPPDHDAPTTSDTSGAAR